MGIISIGLFLCLNIFLGRHVIPQLLPISPANVKFRQRAATRNLAFQFKTYHDIGTNYGPATLRHAMNNHQKSRVTSLCVESLEDRMMLSTVSLEATGQEGGENINVYVRDQLVLDATLSTTTESFEVSLEEQFTANDVRIEFLNDLYQPENGVDRNVTINALSVDGFNVDFFNEDMFSTGTWLPEDGVTPGNGRGNTLHANGYFQLLGDPIVYFGDREWVVDGPASSVFVNTFGDLEMSPESGPVSVSAQYDIEGGTLYRMTIEAYRDVLDSFGSDGQPWATVGINFYGEDGSFLGQERTDVSGNQSDPGSTQLLEFESPADATSAYVWAWIGQGPYIPLVVSDIQLQPIDLSGDTTPTTVDFQNFTLQTPTGNELNFGVSFTDDTRRGNVIAQPFRVTGPNGFNELAGVRTGVQGSTDTFQTLIYGLTKSDGSDWSPADNGTYTVELLDNAVFDAAGNVTQGGVVGQFDVAIVLPPPDTEAPGITLGTSIPTLTQPTTEVVEFVIYTTDNADPIPFVRNGITVTRDGAEVNIRGIAGGFDAANDRNWELYYIFPPTDGNWNFDDNGTYVIELTEGGLVDRAGNEAPAQVLGSFEVNIEDFPV